MLRTGVFLVLLALARSGAGQKTTASVDNELKEVVKMDVKTAEEMVLKAKYAAAAGPL